MLSWLIVNHSVYQLLIIFSILAIDNDRRSCFLCTERIQLIFLLKWTGRRKNEEKRNEKDRKNSRKKRKAKEQKKKKEKKRKADRSSFQRFPKGSSSIIQRPCRPYRNSRVSCLKHRKYYAKHQLSSFTLICTFFSLSLSLSFFKKTLQVLLSPSFLLSHSLFLSLSFLSLFDRKYQLVYNTRDKYDT